MKYCKVIGCNIQTLEACNLARMKHLTSCLAWFAALMVGFAAGRGMADEVIVLSGRVTGADGEPISGARISITDINDVSIEKAYARSDDNGEYRIEYGKLKSENNLRLWVSSFGKSYEPKYYDVDNSSFTQSMNFAEVRLVELQGSISHSDGTPVRGCIIRVYDESTGGVVRETESDDGGRFSVSLPPNDYKIEADARDEGLSFPSHVVRISTSGGYDPVSLVAKAGARIKGRLVFANGEGISGYGGVVLIRSSDLSVVGNLTLYPGKRDFAFGGLEPGSYTLRYLSGEYSAKTNVVLTKDDESIAVELWPYGKPSDLIP